MMEYEGGARVKPDIICDMNSRDGEGASRSQNKRSEQSTTNGDGPESSVGATCRKRQRSRSRDRLMKTPGLWGGHEHRSSRSGSPRPALSSIFPCGPVLRNTSNNNASATHPPAQSRKTCDESASSVIADGQLVGGKLFFSDGSREEQGEEEEDEEVALREKGHRMAFLSYRGISEEFLSLLDELTYEDSSDEYKRKRGRNSHDDAVVEDDGFCYFPAECPMPQPRTIDGACDEFFPENAIQGCDDPEIARHGLTSDLCA